MKIMQTLEVEVLEHISNNPVVRLPTRKYPGVLIQGDSLSILLDLAKDIKQQLDRGDIDEAISVVKELEENLQGRVAIYERALEAHGIDIPYHRTEP